jgi:hypothetical protein
VTKQLAFLRVIYRSDTTHVRAINERLDLLRKVSFLGDVLRLTGQHQRHAYRLRDPNRVQRVFPRAHPTEEDEILARFEARVVGIEVASVIDDGEFASGAQPETMHLAAADTDDREVWPASKEPFIVDRRAGM